MNKPKSVAELSPKELLELARHHLGRARSASMKDVLGSGDRSDPSNPPPDPAQLQDAMNLWRIVENKAARAAHVGAATVPLTSSELAGLQRMLGRR